MEIVLTGSTGKLGGALQRAWSEGHDVIPMGRDRADFRHPESLRRELEEISFDVLVNCAAISSPEDCEDCPAEAHQVNAQAPGELAAICAERGARFVHLSTDYVLDGREEGLKDENAPTGPINHYGLTKLEGERLVLEHDPSALVCRVSWLFGTTPPGFLETILQRARDGEDLAAVDDKFSMPTCASDVARTLHWLIERDYLTGIHHLTSQGEPESWWSYGTKVLALAHELGFLDDLKEIRGLRLADVPGLSAPRPIHTAMRPGRLCAELDWRVPRWEESARARIERLLD